LNNDYNDGIALWGGYIDFNCQTVDGASQGYRNNIFSWQRYGTEIMYLNSSAELGVAGNVRAPIYYDSNDTAWRMDPTDYSYFRYLKMRSSGTSSGTRALSVYQEGTGEINFGSYPGAWTSAVQIQDNSGSQFMWLSPLSSIGYGMIYHNAYPIYFYGGGGFAGAAHNGSLRSPIFYDSDDTTYYANFNTTGISVNTRGAIRVTDYYSGNGYPNWSDVVWMGRYDSSQTSYPMYSPGDMFGIHMQRSSDGCSFGMVTRGGGYNDYNIVMNWGDDAGDILQYRFNNSVIAQMNEGGGMYAPIYYDQNNSGYYEDPNGNSRLNRLTPNMYYWYGVGGDSGQGGEYYAMYQEAGGWGYPYPDLIIANHTGIKIGAYYGYNGTRFYNNSPHAGSQIASIGDGDNAMRSYDNIIAYASDRRLKENIVNIPDALAKVKTLNGVTFDWKDMVEDLGFSPSKKHEAGVIAQEVEAVLPEAIDIAPFDYDWAAIDGSKSKSGEKYLTVNYEKIVPLLIEAIKEQQTQIESQQSQIDELRELIKNLQK
jgi:hypothetical protein